MRVLDRAPAQTLTPESGLRGYIRRLFRPWKLVTFLLGTGFFVWGALYWALPTWDVGVSIWMSVLCYLLAPWSVGLGIDAIRVRTKGWGWRLLLSALVIYFVGSGSYEIYNTIRMGRHPITYWENLFFSVPVTIMAGIVWGYDGSVTDLLADVRKAFRDGRRSRNP